MTCRGGSIELPSIGMGTRVNGGANAQMTVGRDPITNGSKWGIEDESDSDSDSAGALDAQFAFWGHCSKPPDSIKDCCNSPSELQCFIIVSKQSM